MSEDINVGGVLEALNGKVDIDLGNVTTETKETVVGWGMPDYSAGIITSTLPFTAPANGIFMWMSKDNTYSAIKINNVDVSGDGTMQVARGMNGFVQIATILISKGDVITSQHGSFQKGMFFPAKGAK